MQATITTPTTIEQVKATNNYIIAKSHAEATVEASKRLTTAGPITSKKIFFDKTSNSVVYEYYRVRNKEQKVYVIF